MGEGAQPFEKIERGGLMEGKRHCEVRSSLWIPFCSIFKRKLVFKRVKRKSKERSIFCCGSALPKNPKAAPGERKMHPKNDHGNP